MKIQTTAEIVIVEEFTDDECMQLFGSLDPEKILELRRSHYSEGHAPLEEAIEFAVSVDFETKITDD